ncbi:hypothetical protein RMATCC62417_11365 [Rhizopus microsporus]|nr:hypothetical protein RMATCC62417_11365 [Rhizopus microsporus]
MKLSFIINRKQSDSRLGKTLKTKFGEDSILVMDNWGTKHTKFHEPIRGKGMRRMLKKEGLQVYLIDEFKTSSICPTCKDGQLEAFLKIQNLRPFRRAKNPVIECHRLLRCTNRQCLQPFPRLWNRDLAAVLNFRHIMDQHRQALGWPSRFAISTLKRTVSEDYAPSTSKNSALYLPMMTALSREGLLVG